ncbi:MAG: aminotransferase class III-fold pyridoxal phosphate-dependent enzyme [Pseudonocardiaceae bacterium]
MRPPLAIVGMACRAPGAADYHTLWEKVEAGANGMVEVGGEDRRREGISLDPAVRNQYVPMVAPLDDYDQFDSAAFGISAGEANAINLNHCVLMEVVLEALEDAGCDPRRHPGNIGVFAAGGGASPISVMQRRDDPQFGDAARPLKASEALNWTALLDNDFLATRIAYALDLRGPSVTVQTACSSSLVSVHLACQSLSTGESDVAIAGGVNVEKPHRAGYYYQPGSIWSDDGYCRPFDRAAGGTITASGAGAVVIKRLEQALADGDAIHAIIRGGAINNDGHEKIGFTAPSVNQQSLVIGAALAVAGVDKRDIGYLETHGTATAVGDIVEWTAIERALGHEGVRCALGATKANVGHLGAASGIVSLIKAALVLSHERIPPVANFVELNPHITPKGNRLFVPDQSSPWKVNRMPRRAGVSSMGIGGTNAHIILEQAPAADLADEPREGVYILPVSAASKRSVEHTADRIETFAEQNPSRLRSLAHTMRTGRRVLPNREAIVVARRDDAVTIWRTGSRSAKPDLGCAVVFPGQGGELGDLTAAIADIPGFGDLFSEAIQCLPTADQPLVRGLLTGVAEIESTPRLVELAVVVRSVTIARSLLADGLPAQALCGFSLGEVAAGVIGGVFTLSEAATVISERARILASTPAGGMIRVRLPENAIAPYLHDDVSLAIVPGGRDCMLSGAVVAIDEVAARLRADGVASIRVPVPHPFHSAVLRDAVAEYEAVWSQVDLLAPSLRLMSPTTGDFVDDETARDPRFWASHLIRTARFGDAMTALRAIGTELVHVLDSDRGVTPFVKDVFGADALAMSSTKQAGYDTVSRARFLATAWSVGHDAVALTTGGIDQGSGSDAPMRVVHAPTYAFDHSDPKERPSIPTGNGESGPAVRPEPVRSVAAQQSSAPVAASVPMSSERADPVDAGAVGDAVRRTVATLAGMAPEDVGPDDSFVDLGYDSFLLIQLADALSAEFATTIEVRQLFFELDSCRGMSEHLVGIGVSSTVTSEPVARPEPVRSVAAGQSSAPVAASVPVRPEGDTPDDIARQPDSETPLHAETAWAQRTPVSKRIIEEDRYALADQRNLVSIRKGRRESSYPVVGIRGDGARFMDADGREYLDLCMGFGVIMLGHASEPLTIALRGFDPSDLLLGPQSSTAGDVARGIASLTGVDRVAFTSSGTEAVMGAVRAARAKTGRDLIALFSGSYHGTFDGVLVSPRANGRPGEAAPLGRGTPASMVENVIVLPYDESAIPVLESYGDRLAAVLVEPVQSRRPGYQPVELLQSLRTLTSAQGAALIFDEVITGFRCHPGGAAALFGVRPDLVVYGKVIGGGMPVGVIAGAGEFMAPIDGGRWREEDVGFPQRPSMMFAGTFSKHPLAMAVAQQMIRYFKKESPRLQAALADRTTDLAKRINDHVSAHGFPIDVEHFSSLFRINVRGSGLSDDMFFLGLLNRGIYVWEGRTCFLSAAHTDADCSRIVEAVAETAAEVAAQGLWDDARPTAPLNPTRTPLTVVAGAPLTDGQKLMWLAGELGGELAQSYQMSMVLRLEGTLDPARLRRAIEQAAQRHEALRLNFDDDGATQSCDARAVPELTVTDSSDASPSDIEQILHQFAMRPADPSARSLFRFHLVRSNEASFLQVTAPHSVVDGWSFEVLCSELSAYYLDAAAGDTMPEPASFLEYARWKRDDEDAQVEANAAALWSARLDPAWESARLLPGGGAWKPDTRVDVLSAESLARLRDVVRAGGGTMHTAAISALAVASASLTGADWAVIMAHSARQPRYTDKPLVGFGVDLLPMIVELSDGDTMIDVARAVQEQTLESAEINSGLYRIMQNKRYRRLPANLIAFNYERQTFTTIFGLAAAPVGSTREAVPWPAIVTIEERDNGIELTREISPASDFAPVASQLAPRMEQILANPTGTLAEFRRQ